MSERVCIVCGGPGISKCSRCKMTYYCGRDCQRKDYPGHRKGCVIHAPPETPSENPKNETDLKPYFIKETANGTGRGVFTRLSVQPGTVIFEDTSMQTIHRGVRYRETATFREIAEFTPEKPGESHKERLMRSLRKNGTQTSTDTYDIYRIARFVNHHCTPNARMIHYAKGCIRIVATHFIPAGEEVTVSYIPTNFCSLEARESDLPFKCLCDTCVNPDNAAEDFRTKFSVTLGMIMQGAGVNVSKEIEYSRNCLDAAKLIAGEPGLDFLTETVLVLYISRFKKRSKKSESFRRDILETMIDLLKKVINVFERIGSPRLASYQEQLRKILECVEPIPAA